MMKMKKILLGAVSLLSVVTLAACGSQSKTDTSVSDIEKAGKLVVAVSPDYAPFEFKALVDGKDKVVGSDIELAQAIADDLGVKLEVSTMSFTNVLSSLQSGKADIAISGISLTKEREKSFDFSDAYYQTENAILVRKSELENYTSLDQFAGKKVAVQKGTIEEGLVNDQLTESNVVALTAMGEAVNELKNGQVDAVDLEYPVAEGYASQNDDIVIAKVALKVADGDAKAIAMPKGSTALKTKINALLKKMAKDDTYSQYIKNASQYTVIEE